MPDNEPKFKSEELRLTSEALRKLSSGNQIIPASLIGDIAGRIDAQLAAVERARGLDLGYSSNQLEIISRVTESYLSDLDTPEAFLDGDTLRRALLLQRQHALTRPIEIPTVHRGLKQWLWGLFHADQEITPVINSGDPIVASVYTKKSEIEQVSSLLGENFEKLGFDSESIWSTTNKAYLFHVESWPVWITAGISRETGEEISMMQVIQNGYHLMLKGEHKIKSFKLVTVGNSRASALAGGVVGRDYQDYVRFINKLSNSVLGIPTVVLTGPSLVETGVPTRVYYETANRKATIFKPFAPDSFMRPFYASDINKMMKLWQSQT